MKLVLESVCWDREAQASVCVLSVHMCVCSTYMQEEDPKACCSPTSRHFFSTLLEVEY